MEGYLFGALNSCIKIWFDHSISCHCRSNSTSWLERTIGSFIFEVEHVNLQIYTDSVILQLHSTPSPYSSIKSFSQLENFYSQTSCHITTSSECFSKKSGLNKLSVLMRYFMFIFFYFIINQTLLPIRFLTPHLRVFQLRSEMKSERSGMCSGTLAWNLHQSDTLSRPDKEKQT